MLLRGDLTARRVTVVSCAQVAQGMPTAVTIASKTDTVAARVQSLFSTPRFRCYRTTDVEGERAGPELSVFEVFFKAADLLA